MEGTPDGDESTRARLWDELRIIQDTLMKVWQAYMIWSVWFLTALYGTLTYVAGFDKDNTKSSMRVVNAAAAAAVFLDLVAIGATIILWRYTREATDRAKILSKSPGFHPEINPRTMMAAGLLTWICSGFLISYAFYLLLWGYFYCCVKSELWPLVGYS